MAEHEHPGARLLVAAPGKDRGCSTCPSALLSSLGRSGERDASGVYSGNTVTGATAPSAEDARVPIPLVMMARLTALITHAAQGPGSRPVRFSLAAFTLGQAVALMISTGLQTAGGPSWETDIVVAAGLNVQISPVLVAAPWHALDDKTAAVVLGAAVVGSHFIGTHSHGVLDLRAWYEMAGGLLITMVVLAGTISMKYFLMRNAEILSEQNEELDARVRELTAVSSLARSVGAAADRGLMLRQGLLMALEATVCDAGILFLWTEDGALEPHHWIGLSDEVATALCRKATRDTPPAVARWAAGESGTVVVPDMSKWSYTGDTVGPAQTVGAAEMPVGIQGSLTAVPIAIEGTMFGALVVIDSRGLLPSERGMKVLEAVAAELALAVDRQHHVDEGKRPRHQLVALPGLARRMTASLNVEEVLEFAVGEAAALVDADAARIATLTGNERRIRIVAQHGP